MNKVHQLDLVHVSQHGQRLGRLQNRLFAWFDPVPNFKLQH